jgi:hypothetical protein
LYIIRRKKNKKTRNIKFSFFLLFFFKLKLILIYSIHFLAAGLAVGLAAGFLVAAAAAAGLAAGLPDLALLTFALNLPASSLIRVFLYLNKNYNKLCIILKKNISF